LQSCEVRSTEIYVYRRNINKKWKVGNYKYMMLVKNVDSSMIPYFVIVIRR